MPAIVALFGRTNRFRTKVGAGPSATPDYGALRLRGSVGLRRASTRERTNARFAPYRCVASCISHVGVILAIAQHVATISTRALGAERSAMRSYLITRVYALILTLFLLTIVVFSLLLMIPGDVVQMIIGAEAEHVSPEFVAELRHFFGLDLPWYKHSWRWARPLLRGDMGISWRTGKPVSQLIADRLPVTGELTLLSVGLALVLGIIAGVISALYRDRLV